MGNIFAECQRCSLQQCELCTELLPRRGRGQGSSAGNNGFGSPGSGNAGGRGGWHEGAGLAGNFHQDYQPSNMSESDLIRLAQQRSMQGQRGPAQPARPGEDVSAFGTAHMQRLVDDATDPALLYAAIAASHATLPTGFREPNGPPTEEELTAQAIRTAQIELEAKERAMLRDEQAREYEESLRVDRQRETERQQKQRDEEQKRKEEEEARAKIEEEEERKRKEEEEAKAKAEVEEKARIARVAALVEEARGRLSEEPPKEEAGRVAVLIRTPEGKALKRSFRGADEVSQLYDYTTVEGGEMLASQEFRLITNMPKTVYEDRKATLQAVGLQGKCALLVEIIEPSEDPGGE